MEERITSLELKIMDLEHTVSELNGVVTEQYRVIQKLELSHKILHERLNSLTTPETADARDEPPPPHY